MPVPYHTSYTFFQEGDLKRAIMDAYSPSTPMAERRSEYVFDGKYCIYWDNYEGVNPQPWAKDDCGLQALWLNDDYYECAEAGLTGEDSEDCNFDDFAFFSQGDDWNGCLETDDDGVCTEYDCLVGYY